MSRWRPQSLVVLAVLVGALTACGGGGDADDGGGTTASPGGGDLVIGGDLELPDDFPSDFYIPDSVTITSFTGSADAPMMSLGGTYEGDAAAVVADMSNGLQAAGYELLSQDDDITVFIKDGLGRIRIRAREFLGEPTLTVDVDNWTDDQIAELRELFAAEITTTGSATATYGGDTMSATGECTIKGETRWFFADDVSITLQLDPNLPGRVYADITTADGIVYTIDTTASSRTETSATGFSASGKMVEFNNESAGTIDFTIEATCDA